MQVLGLPEGSVRSFVLENDPVPRALLSVDPTYTALRNSQPGAALLRLRSWLLGPGVPLTPDRFLADNVGEVNLLRWTPDGGHRVGLADKMPQTQHSRKGKNSFVAWTHGGACPDIAALNMHPASSGIEFKYHVVDTVNGLQVIMLRGL